MSETSNDNTGTTSSQPLVDGESVRQFIQAQFATLSGNQIQHQQEMINQQAAHQHEMETSRRNHETQMEMRRTKIDMIRVATDTLAANAKSKPADERDITASDIKTFAEELIDYINQE
jgi:hypothetical protein